MDDAAATAATKKTKRLDKRYQKTDSGCLLYFNEIEGMDEKNTLDLYYDALKNPACGGGGSGVYNLTNNDFDGTG